MTPERVLQLVLTVALIVLVIVAALWLAGEAGLR